MTPLLVLVFGFNPTTAIGTDILHGAVFKTVGAYRHRRLKHVYARLSGWMLIASAPMSLVGVWIATWIKHRYGDSTESVAAQVLGVALIVGAIGLALKTFMRIHEGDWHGRLTRRDRIAALLIGFFGGLIVGLTSVGTGVFFGLSLLILFPMRSAKVVGTDIFHAAALLWVAGAGHFVAGNVDLAACGWLLLGSIPGVLVGSQLTLRFPDRSLRIALATVLALSGAKLADVPHPAFVLPAILLVGLSAIAWLAAQHLRRPAIPEPVREPAAVATGSSRTAVP